MTAHCKRVFLSYLSQRWRKRKPSISALIPPSEATLCLFRIVCVGFFFDVMFFCRQRLVCQHCGIVSLVLSRLSRKREPLMNLAQREYSNRGPWAGKQEREMRICESSLEQWSPTPGLRTSTGLWVIWYPATQKRKTKLHYCNSLQYIFHYICSSVLLFYLSATPYRLVPETVV